MEATGICITSRGVEKGPRIKGRKEKVKRRAEKEDGPEGKDRTREGDRVKRERRGKDGGGQRNSGRYKKETTFHLAYQQWRGVAHWNIGGVAKMTEMKDHSSRP